MSTTPQIQSSTRETKHTPGPYGLTAESRTLGCFVISGPLHKHVKVAAILPQADHAEFVANARLLSAAHDLLQAVKVAKEFFINPGKFNPLDVERIYEAAIRKAEKGGL